MYRVAFATGPQWVTTSTIGPIARLAAAAPDTTVTVTSGAVTGVTRVGVFEAATVGDLVWADVNGNGLQDSGEPGVAGVTVTISGPGGTATTTTGTGGTYGFGNLAPGEWTVTFTAPAGRTSSAALAGADRTIDSDGETVTVTVTSGQSVTGVDYGAIPHATINGIVWHDTNGDGIHDGGESGAAGVSVTLTGPGGTRTTSSSANGAFGFGGLLPGGYVVSFSSIDGRSTPASRTIRVLGGQAASVTGTGGYITATPTTTPATTPTTTPATTGPTSPIGPPSRPTLPGGTRLPETGGSSGLAPIGAFLVLVGIIAVLGAGGRGRGAAAAADPSRVG